MRIYTHYFGLNESRCLKIQKLVLREIYDLMKVNKKQSNKTQFGNPKNGIVKSKSKIVKNNPKNNSLKNRKA